MTRTWTFEPRIYCPSCRRPDTAEPSPRESVKRVTRRGDRFGVMVRTEYTCRWCHRTFTRTVWTPFDQPELPLFGEII